MKKTSGKIRRLEGQLRRAKTRLRALRDTVEDLQDRLDLEKAIVLNAGKPGIPWEIVAKELGIRPPAKKRKRKS